MHFYIGNISHETTSDDLERLFSRFGDISSIRIVQKNNPCSGTYSHPSVSAFLDFSNLDDDQFYQLTALNNTRWRGSKIRVEKRLYENYLQRLYQTPNTETLPIHIPKELTPRLVRKEHYRLREYFRNKRWKIRAPNGDIVEVVHDLPVKRFPNDMSRFQAEQRVAVQEGEHETGPNKSFEIQEGEHDNMRNIMSAVLANTLQQDHVPSDSVTEEHVQYDGTATRDSDEDDDVDKEASSNVSGSVDVTGALAWLQHSNMLVGDHQESSESSGSFEVPQHQIHPSRLKKKDRQSDDGQSTRASDDDPLFSLASSFVRSSGLDEVVETRQQKKGELLRKVKSRFRHRKQ
ncbi:hypothetical protein GEMRC1_006636 [Eukaryota sp. GEM-RC1]